ncbi:MAG: putative TonB-dependent receptor [Nitrospira sp.]|jgi:iron complex outermembrane receptor protein|nr:putative TonB-dependent receptor [Nitrospira sp.]
MATQFPHFFFLSAKPHHLHQIQLFIRVVLSMSALCLLAVDVPSVLAQPDTSGLTTNEPSTTSDDETLITKQRDVNVPELELIKEEESAVIAGGLFPGRAELISKAPSDVYVITDEDIRHSGAIDLPTVLRRIPGIDVMQVTGADFNVSVRGDNQLQQNKMLVLVDGRSIYEDIQGQVWWKSIPITLPEIKRIEVLKGPASVLYGFNAFDGVINIITKSPQEMKGTTVQFGGGELGTISSAAIQAGVYKNWGYRLSIGRDQTNQWNNRDALAFRDHKFNGQVEYAMADKSRVTFSGGIVDTNRFDGPVFDILHGSTKISNGYANALYERPNFFIRAWWQTWNDNFTSRVDPRIARFISVGDASGNPTNSATQNSYNLESQHSIELVSNNRLTYGFNYRHNTGSSPLLDQYVTENRLGIFFQDEWRATESLTAVAGLRYDLDTFINPTYSPRGAIIYQLAENHTIRVSASVAYRPPTIFETHGSAASSVFFPGIPPFVPSSVTPGRLAGASNLSPEQIASYELGYQGWFLKHRVRVRGNLFFNHISNLIARTRPADNPRLVTFFNNGSADIYGFEVGVEFLATSWLSGFINYSYQEIGQKFTIQEVTRGAPRDKINAGLRGEWANGLSGEAAVHYVSSATYPISGAFSQFTAFPFNASLPPSTTVGSYTLLNLRGAYQFWHEHAEVAITAFSALNDKHKEHPLGDTIGSRVMGWLTLRY